jgi:NADH:ubiquinone oxidoreductase subunit E
MSLEYEFELMSDGKYQVRLCGEFVCYTTNPSEDYVDEILWVNGYKSRQSFLDDCFK